MLLRRFFSTSRAIWNIRLGKPLANTAEVDELLKIEPKWSVTELLTDPPTEEQQTVTSEQINKLLKLSGLPKPTTPEEESATRSVLLKQLAFINHVHSFEVSETEFGTTDARLKPPPPKITYEDLLKCDEVMKSAEADEKLRGLSGVGENWVPTDLAAEKMDTGEFVVKHSLRESEG